MTSPEAASEASPPARASWRDGLLVYLQRRVLVVLLLGFSAGLPFSLAGQTLQAWMTESGVDIKTIGLFAFVGTPYWTKVFWSPAVDALDIPVLSPWLGRRRAWLLLTQVLLLVSAFVKYGFDQQKAYSATYIAMAVLIVVGMLATVLGVEPESSVLASAEHTGPGHDKAWQRLVNVAIASLKDFLSRDAAVAILLSVVLFKLADAMAVAMNTTFALKMGFSRVELAAILKGVGFAAALRGGFAGGIVARSFPLSTSLWIGGILQAVAILPFSWQAIVGNNAAWLTFAITAEQFTAGLGTVTFVAYLSALCGNPLHTATQYALLTALTALGRTVFAAGSGYLAEATGWFGYFLVCAASAIPSFILLAYLQRRGHFETLGSLKS